MGNGKQCLMIRIDYAAMVACVFFACVGTGDDPRRVAAKVFPQLNVFLILSSQFLFAVALGWIICRMCSGNLPMLSNLLGSPIWVPFARLSFSAYLLQFIAILFLEPSFDPVAGANL